MVLFVLVVVLAAFWAGDGRAEEPSPCASPLPRGPAVPAPVVLRTSCGAFRLAPDGRVTRLSRHWFDVRSGGTGRRYGADVRVRRTRPGRIVLLRGKRVVWRSAALYPNDAGDVAFGPGAYAFAAHRRGIFATDLRSPERLVLRGGGLSPLAFLSDRTLLVADWSATTVSRITLRGAVLVRYRHSPNGFVFDPQTEALHVATRERELVRVTVHGSTVVRSLRRLEGWLSLMGRHLALTEFRHRGGSDDLGITLLTRDGRLVSRWRWRTPKRATVDYGPLASTDGRSFVFRTVSRGRRDVTVYLLRAGESRPRAVFRHRGGPLGCGVGASFSWRGRFALYSATDGPAAIVDGRTARVTSLRRVLSALPTRSGERPLAHWETDFRPNHG